MIVATTPYIGRTPHHRDEGMVFGLVVRSRGLGGNIMAGLRSIGGGEIHEYTELLEDTRRQAIDGWFVSDPRRRERGGLHALRQLRDREHDVGDRGLRDGGRRRGGRDGDALDHSGRVTLAAVPGAPAAGAPAGARV